MAKDFPQLTKEGTEALIKSEGSIPYVYDDAVYPTRPWKPGERIRGNLTAGVGHLLSLGDNIFPEAKKWIGKDIPKSQIDRWLDADTDEAERAVHKLVKVPLTSYQRNALVSFTFNVGVGAFKGSTLLKKLNKGDYAAVPNELKKWVKTTINGKKVTSAGLQKRRADEITMWIGGSAPKAPSVDVPSGTQIAERAPDEFSPMEALTGAGAIIGPAAGFANSTGFVAVAFGIGFLIAVVVIAAIIVKKQFFSK